MKNKIGYILILFMLLIAPVSVFAAENITFPETEIEISEGRNGTFDIVVYDAMAVGTVTVSDEDVISLVTYDSEEGFLGESGRWMSAGAINMLPGKTKSHTIIVKALGKAGDTATVNIKIDDATDYATSTHFADSSNPIEKTIKVKIVEKSSEPSTTYTIIYNANEGKDAPANQTKSAGETITLQTAKPTREGYEFTGWNTKADGSGTKYASGGNYVADENVTLYAQWKKSGNATTNPNTGDTIIYVVLLLTLGALIYSYWYMKKAQEN